MIIQKDGQRLLQAGTFRTVSHDDYSVSVEAYGLDEKTGDGVTYRIVLSFGELYMLQAYLARNGISQEMISKEWMGLVSRKPAP